MLPKIVFFDMEGTLFAKANHLDDGIVAPSAWTLLAERLGPDCLREENESKVRWLGGGYSGYLEWMRDTVEIHRRHGLRREVFDEVLGAVQVMPGAMEALARIHSWGTVSVLVTGGFKALADKLQKELGIHHAFSSCEHFFADNGEMTHANLLPADEMGKVDLMRLICREYRVETCDCAFVGDGMNDVHLAREVGFSVAFNAQPALVAASTCSVVQVADAVDFSVVARLIENHFLNRRESARG